MTDLHSGKAVLMPVLLVIFCHFLLSLFFLVSKIMSKMLADTVTEDATGCLNSEILCVFFSYTVVSLNDLIGFEIVPVSGAVGLYLFVFCMFMSRLNSFAAFCYRSVCVDKAPNLSWC